jgi:hypothetical protein
VTRAEDGAREEAPRGPGKAELPPEFADPAQQRRLMVAGTLGFGCLPVLLFGAIGAVFAFFYFNLLLLAAAVVFPVLPIFLVLRRLARLPVGVSIGTVVLASLGGHLLVWTRLLRPLWTLEHSEAAALIILLHLLLIPFLRWLEPSPANAEPR